MLKWIELRNVKIIFSTDRNKDGGQNSYCVSELQDATKLPLICFQRMRVLPRAVKSAPDLE